MRTLLADDEKADTTGFGARLESLRKDAGLSRQQLGERTGITGENIARLERGDRSPSWKTVIKLAKALEVEPNDFLSPDTLAPDDEDSDNEDKPRRGKK